MTDLSPQQHKTSLRDTDITCDQCGKPIHECNREHAARKGWNYDEETMSFTATGKTLSAEISEANELRRALIDLLSEIECLEAIEFTDSTPEHEAAENWYSALRQARNALKIARAEPGDV